jgi:hypothetical protein
MRDLYESRKNMRIDMRAGAVAKIMTKELLLLVVGATFAIGMPLYYLKLKRIKAEYAEQY